MVLLAGILITRLFVLQIVRGADYQENYDLTVEKDETIAATRGNIYDCNGKLLAYNELAYAITIHKSQGSEYPAVVIPLLSGPSMLMNRNLLYTAVTRARKCVTLVGNDATFNQMIQNTSQQKRYSGLCDRIRESVL